MNTVLRNIVCIGACWTILTGLASPACAGINEWTYVGLAPEVITDIEAGVSNADSVWICSYDVFGDSLQEGGLFRTSDRGLTMDTVGFRHTNVWDAAIDPWNTQTIWVANDERGLWRSMDGGLTWARRDSGIFIGGVDHFGPYAVAVCPHDPQKLLCATGSHVSMGRLYFSDTGGTNWSRLDSIWMDGFNRRILYDPSDAGLVYAYAEVYSRLYVSSDSGRSFPERINLSWAYSLQDLDICPNRAGALWAVTYEGAVMHSADYGCNWEEIIPSRPGLDSIIVSMDVWGSGDTIAFGGSREPFLSYDGGLTIIPLLNGYPHRRVSRIKIISDIPLEVWAFMHDEGIWDYTVVDSLDTRRGNPRIAETVSLLSIFPNPFNPTTTLTFTLPRSSPVTLTVFNLLGQSVYETDFGRLEAGEHRQIFDGSALPSGVYVARVEAAGTVQMKKMVLLR